MVSKQAKLLMMIIGIRQVEVEEDIDQNSETFEMEMEIENSSQGSYTTFIEISVYLLSIELLHKYEVICEGLISFI